ncbi:CvfB family protein [Tepidibacillus decaturensis]|uniref:S1 motif domain-containing protein n=1 Tax=Tepidibacillus decaturensis TaxID=1413211 RepID=A0A135L2H9_9BACI|nr:S1-like domain-containing RNA-binding protein [Tepidibacillus decaturensis]KXG43150.1 hypothetical protein U473_03275 [Tepidibacillus decaturensis]
MSLQTGMYYVLKVERESPFGYFLSDGTEDVLLHFSETNQQKFELGDQIEVFLYNDHKGRIAATLHTPKIVMGEIGFLTVDGYETRMGFFLDNGISKQVLLPISELPEEKKIWPKPGDQLLVKLVHDKQKRLLAHLVDDEQEIKSFIDQQLDGHLPDPIKQTQFVKGIVLRHISVGAHVYLENHQIGFLHRMEQIHELRLGENVQVRLTFVRDDGRVNLSMKPLKQTSRIEDADRILEVLHERGGAMPYWDKTPPDILQKKFNLSKAAFKRALGKLMKDGVIYQEEGWTYLKNRDEL